MTIPKSIRISKPTQSQWLLLTLLLLPFAVPFLTELFPLPTAIRYLLDPCWVLLLVLLVLNRRRLKGIRLFCCWAGLFLGYGTLTWLLNMQSPFYLLWGIRNNFRFYVAFAAVACFWKEKDRDACMKCLDVLFWVNALLTPVQFFLMDVRGDYLGGIFGVQHGCNGYTNIFLIICLAKTVLWYLNGREKLIPACTRILVSLLIVALAEIKFFFAEAVAVIALAVLITRFSWKKVLILLFAAAALAVGAALLVYYFPEFNGFYELEEWIAYGISARGYTSSGDLNRLNAISRISEELLTTTRDRLFGLGLGNCDTASFGFLQTPFSVKYEALHYTWLSTAFVFLEMGWIGLGFYFGFFALVWFRAGRLGRQGGEHSLYCQLAMVLAVICVMISIYNSTLRTEAGYLMYFVMALAFIKRKQYGMPQNTSRKGMLLYESSERDPSKDHIS